MTAEDGADPERPGPGTPAPEETAPVPGGSEASPADAQTEAASPERQGSGAAEAGARHPEVGSSRPEDGSPPPGGGAAAPADPSRRDLVPRDLVPRDRRTVAERTGRPRATDPEVARRIGELAPWFHNLHLPDGTQTAPDHPLGDFPARKWRLVEPLLPADLSGWTALDVGCNAGFHAFELAKRGARVTAVDHDPKYLEQARWAAGQMGLEDRVEVRRADVYDLARPGGPLGDRKFDLVLFLGVFYHLRYPLLGLDAVAQRVGRRLVFQSLTVTGALGERQEVGEDEDEAETEVAAADRPATPGAARTPGGIPTKAEGGGDEGGDPGDARRRRRIEPLEPLEDLDLADSPELMRPGRPRMAFVEYALAGDPTNWWIPDRPAVEALLRSAGLDLLDRSGEDVYLCRPQENPERRDWARQYLQAAMGHPPD